LAFTVLSLFQGMLVFALAARMSRSSPSPAGLSERGSAMFTAGRIAVAARLAERGSAILTAGRIAVAAVFLVALPGFVTSVADIL
jgi:hypothetical protein